MQAWNLVHVYSLGPWTFSEVKSSHKRYVAAITAILFSTIAEWFIFYHISW